MNTAWASDRGVAVTMRVLWLLSWLTCFNAAGAWASSARGDQGSICKCLVAASGATDVVFANGHDRVVEVHASCRVGENRVFLFLGKVEPSRTVQFLDVLSPCESCRSPSRRDASEDPAEKEVVRLEGLVVLGTAGKHLRILWRFDGPRSPEKQHGSRTLVAGIDEAGKNLTWLDAAALRGRRFRTKTASCAFETQDDFSMRTTDQGQTGFLAARSITRSTLQGYDSPGTGVMIRGACFDLVSKLMGAYTCDDEELRWTSEGLVWLRPGQDERSLTFCSLRGMSLVFRDADDRECEFQIQGAVGVVGYVLRDPHRPTKVFAVR